MSRRKPCAACDAYAATRACSCPRFVISREVWTAKLDMAQYFEERGVPERYRVKEIQTIVVEEFEDGTFVANKRTVGRTAAQARNECPTPFGLPVLEWTLVRTEKRTASRQKAQREALKAAEKFLSTLRVKMKSADAMNGALVLKQIREALVPVKKSGGL